jgi:glycosyltransferase involved in cell wall biosynthesis
VIFTWHEVWGEYWYEYMGKIGLFGKIVERLVSKLASESIAVSEMTKKGLESLGVSGKNVHIVPNGIDLKKIGSIQPSVHKCDIIFVGRLIREKNVDMLIEAMVHVKRSMPDVKCYIIGDGPEKQRLEGLAEDKGLSDNIRFPGFMEHDEVIARMKSCKALALPSVREGFGMVVIESFACGLPVITVLHPRNAASELVDEHTGLVIKPDAFELAEAIRLMVSDTAVREERSISALNISKDYDWDSIVRKLMVIYEDAL